MNIKPLNVLRTKIEHHLHELHASASGVSCYYQSKKRWYNTVTGAEVSVSRVVIDGAKKSTSGMNRPRGQSFAYAYIKKFDCLLKIEFTKMLKTEALNGVRARIDRLVLDSDHEFGATHDRHTGLRNRSAFDQQLLESIEQLASIVDSEGSLEVSAQPSQIFLVSLDIDHFKSVNDRFGHGYGDLVLAAFAWRIEKEAEKFAITTSGDVHVDVFRLGGEEFQILVTGSISETEVLLLAETLRAAIHDDVLPSEVEYEKLKGRDFADSVELPSKIDRGITASFGVAVAGGLGVRKPRDITSKLKRQADIALSSAKYGGRNLVRQFSSILNFHGRVGYVDQVNGVISVDMGREVGVKKGQEFFVYPPAYDGETDFFSGEGRSRKRVGTYPKYRVARIVAFDVQNDVSFCRVVQLEAGVTGVSEGSALEAIPLGSIAHLFTELAVNDRFLLLADFKSAIDAISPESKIFLIAVCLRDMERLSEDVGMYKANECLSTMGQIAVDAFGRNAKYCQASTNSIVICMVQDEELELGSVYSMLRERLNGCDVGVGYVVQNPGEKPKDLGQISMSSDMVEAALFAGSTKYGSDSAPAEFTSYVLYQSLSKSRSDRNFNRAVTDYTLFKEFGTTSPLVETQMAHIFNELGRGSAANAEVHFRRAYEDVMEGGDGYYAQMREVIVANLGCWLIVNGKMEEGFGLLRNQAVPKTYESTRFFAALGCLDSGSFDEYVTANSERARTAISESSSWLQRDPLLTVRDAIKRTLGM